MNAKQQILKANTDWLHAAIGKKFIGNWGTQMRYIC